MSRYNVWLSYVMGPNCPNSLQIIDLGLTPKEIYSDRNNLAGYGVFTARQLEAAEKTDLAAVEKIYLAHVENGINSVSRWDMDYPYRFAGMMAAPLVMFYKGDLSLMENRHTVGIVGSRRCNGEGEKACSMIAADVAENGGVIISGLAQGIDTVAHKACVAAGGKTVAFTGVPLDEYFPKTNEKFQKEMENDHLVMSEYHSGYKYRGANFIYRNRLIAMASDGLCVIQAKKKSGSLSTVNHAVEYDKPVFTIPGSIFSPAYEGSNRLLTEGIAHAVTNGRQIMEYLGADVCENTKKKNKKPDISDSAKAVLKSMEGAMFPPQIAKKCGLPAGVVKAALIELEVAHLAEKTATGEYIRLD